MKKQFIGIVMASMCLGLPAFAAEPEKDQSNQGTAATTATSTSSSQTSTPQPPGLAKHGKTPKGLAKQGKTPHGGTKGKAPWKHPGTTSTPPSASTSHPKEWTHHSPASATPAGHGHR